MIAHQKSRAEPKKLTCCSVWTRSLSSVAWNKAGRCQIHRAAAWIAHAANGFVTKCHVDETGPLLITLRVERRQSTGIAQTVAIIGRLNTSIGADTSIRIS